MPESVGEVVDVPLTPLEPATVFEKIPYKVYESLEDKLLALMTGEILYLKSFEKGSGRNVLVRVTQRKYTVSQISFDIYDTNMEPEDRYWTTFNIGLNDLSLYSATKFEEGLHRKRHKYMIDDIITYTSRDGRQDSAVIVDVYENLSNPDDPKYAYMLSREDELYMEDELTENII